MANYIVTRHKATIEWLTKKVPHAILLSHLGDAELKKIKKGDTVIGVLPPLLINKLTKKGVKVYLIHINLPPELRGKDLTQKQFLALKPKLYRVRAIKLTMSNKIAGGKKRRKNTHKRRRR